MWNRMMKRRERKRLEVETDFGRRHGWSLLHGDQVVAELDYVCWDEVAQFWHRYRVRWASGDARIPAEAWAQSGLVLRNRKYSQVEFRDYLVTRGDEDAVLLRGPCIPGDKLIP